MERRCRLSVTVEPNVRLVLVLILLLLPVRWVIAWILAALLHELFHCCGVWACHNRVLHVQIGVRGALIQTDISESWKELLSLLAGPVGALVLLLFSRQFPRIAICALLQSAYNLLPLPGLDGGQALSILLGFVLPRKVTEKVCRAIHKCMCFLILCFGFYAAVWLKLGYTPVLLAVVFFARQIFLANQSHSQYNSPNKTEEVRL